MLTQNHPEVWDEVIDTCEQMTKWYAAELREFRILTHRVYSTFAPFRRRLTTRQKAQLFRCFDYFDSGEDRSRERNAI
jgi:hypothetical protein